MGEQHYGRAPCGCYRAAVTLYAWDGSCRIGDVAELCEPHGVYGRPWHAASAIEQGLRAIAGWSLVTVNGEPAVAPNLYEARRWRLHGLRGEAANNRKGRHVIKLQSYRSRFALESPVGLHAYWSVGQNGNVKSIEVLGGAIGLEPGKWSRPEQTRVGAILHRLGYRTRGDSRPRRYFKAGSP